MTAADLLTDPEFQGFCSHWREHGRAPLPMADWLRDKGMDGQADAAEWAALEPDLGDNAISDSESVGGPTPTNAPESCWAWGSAEGKEGRRWASDLPGDVFKRTRPADSARPFSYVGGKTFPAAIAAFLDAWALARPTGVPA